MLQINCREKTVLICQYEYKNLYRDFRNQISFRKDVNSAYNFETKWRKGSENEH